MQLKQCVIGAKPRQTSHTPEHSLVLTKIDSPVSEVTGVTSSDSDSAPVPKFLNSGPVSSEISDLRNF